MRLYLCALLLAGCASGQFEPTAADLEKACPGAAKVAAIDCPALAVSRCEGAPWAECVERDAVEAECDRMIDAEVAKCGLQ